MSCTARRARAHDSDCVLDSRCSCVAQFHQKEPVGSISLHTGMVLAGLSVQRMLELGIAAQRATSIEAAWLRGGAHKHGVELFSRFRRFNLTMQMRAADDPVHMAHLEHMRDTTSSSPITAEWVRSLRQLSSADFEADPEWRFADIAVLDDA